MSTTNFKVIYWDTKDKKVVYGYEHHLYQDDEGKVFEIKEEGFYDQMVKKDMSSRFIPMDFTGHNDLNNQPIYFGHKLRGIGETSFDVVKNDKNAPVVRTMGRTHLIERYLGDIANSLLIVGTVYE